MIVNLRAQIGWDSMSPDQFKAFYRWTYHLIKEAHNKRHIPLDLANETWHLLLTGRFRLLAPWSDFIMQRKEEVRVVNEDLWTQLFDFSKLVHENLSNFDKNGAWPWLIDDFVDHLNDSRSSHRHPPHYYQSRNGDAMEISDHCTSPSSHQISVIPRIGSKRRSDDLDHIDTVTEQLLAMPLSSGELSQDSKRQCVDLSSSQASQDSDLNRLMGQLNPVQTRGKRIRGARRSGSASVKDLVNQTVSEALGIEQEIQSR